MLYPGLCASALSARTASCVCDKKNRLLITMDEQPVLCSLRYSDLDYLNGKYQFSGIVRSFTGFLYCNLRASQRPPKSGL